MKVPSLQTISPTASELKTQKILEEQFFYEATFLKCLIKNSS